jgi:hypothetical protein
VATPAPPAAQSTADEHRIGVDTMAKPYWRAFTVLTAYRGASPISEHGIGIAMSLISASIE